MSDSESLDKLTVKKVSELVTSLAPSIPPWTAPDGVEYYVFDGRGRPLRREEIERRQVFISPCCGFHAMEQPGHFPDCPFRRG